MSDIINANKEYSLYYFKLGVLLFFATWFLIAFLTNLIDLFNILNLTNQWKFHSSNYLALKEVLHIYNTPDIILNFLFFFNIFIQGISALLFFYASFRYFKNYNAWPLINIAFDASIALWAVFLVMEEIFIAYAYEATHIRLLMLEIISLLSLHLLPSR